MWKLTVLKCVNEMWKLTVMRCEINCIYCEFKTVLKCVVMIIKFQL